MKKVILILVLIFGINMSAQVVRHHKNGEVSSSGRQNVFGNKTGTWSYYYSNGNLKFRGQYKKDRKNGKWKSYYRNKNLKLVAYYKKKKRTGKWVSYFENGNTKYIGYFKKGKRTGEWKFYNENGSLSRVQKY